MAFWIFSPSQGVHLQDVHGLSIIQYKYYLWGLSFPDPDPDPDFFLSESESVAETNLGLEDALEENERDLERERLKERWFFLYKYLLSFMNRVKLIKGNKMRILLKTRIEKI